MNRKVILALQHVLAMFGATVLVPILTGLSIPVALFCAGIGTLLFHLATKGKVPVFLGSSFAFIAGIVTVSNTLGKEYATGAIAVVGLVYLVAALVVKVIGSDRFTALFPPVVVAPIIIVIGLLLSPVAVDMASGNWFVAAITITTVVAVGTFTKGFFRTIPVLAGVTVGYVTSIAFGLVDFQPIKEAAWFSLPDFHSPKFSWTAISIIVPIALVTVIEHIGDITTNGSVVGKNFLKEPGLHRTFIGDALSTSLAGFLGGPANITYGENTGVLALTKNYDPAILRMAACVAIGLSFIGKISAIISTIPTPVMGGISFVLFGMIANIGVKQLIDNKVDLGNMKNSIIFFAPLIIGIVSLTADNPVVIKINENLSFSGLPLSAVIAVTLHFILNICLKRFHLPQKSEAN